MADSQPVFKRHKTGCVRPNSGFQAADWFAVCTEVLGIERFTTLLRNVVLALSVALVACDKQQSSGPQYHGDLGVFDPYWNRADWEWKNIDQSGLYIKHKTAKDCYVLGSDSGGHVLATARITREKTKSFGASYEITRAYNYANALSEVYYSMAQRDGTAKVLSVFVGAKADQCLSYAEDILRKYELDQPEHSKADTRKSNTHYPH